MSIKDLFGRNFIPDKNEKELTEDIESSRNLKAQKARKDAFVPQIDYSNPFSFAKFGSANLYYKSAIDRIPDFYPYDGSDAEITEFYNKSLDIEKYIFDKRYPRTTGYATLSPTSVAVSSKLTYHSVGYGVPSTPEYITLKGGPGVATSKAQPLSKILPDENSSKFQFNNVYDDNLYVNAGLPSDYGSGTRLSNLRSNFDTGVTVEFWAVTGSDITPTQTDRQVFFDMWNEVVSSSTAQDYGRLRIEANVDPGGATSPFLITVQSGTLSASCLQISTSSIGSTSLSSSLSDWNHYAFVFQNSGSDFYAKLYVNGVLDDTNIYASTNIGELSPKNMQARIGALLTAPSGAAEGGVLPTAYAGAGKLSGSLDEFRFWKVARDGQQIGRNWFTQIRGGVNTDISNTTLGVYYKFNEGITGTSSIDSVVLDYGGRVCNGAWTGYSTVSRNTGSAILSASAAIREYEDPIIYKTHPSVVSLKSELEEKGLYHDGQNSSQFINLIPSWVVEEAESKDNATGESDLEKMAHIVGAYFDKLYLQITALPSFRHEQYTSASHKPLPFAQHLPQSLGLMTPEIMIDADVLDKFKDRSDSELYENELNDTKNLIYQNLYNSLTHIFKSKGTAASVRNVLRCFNVDDNLLYFKTYSDNQTYELDTNLKQTLKKKKRLNFNTASALHAVMYNDEDPSLSDSLSYITGAGEPALPGAFPDGVAGAQDPYGLTVEASVHFPRFFSIKNSMDRYFLSSSLFGMQTVFTGSGAGYGGGTTSLTGAQDVANFQVYAVRDQESSKNVRFLLTSSFDPHPFGELTSSTYIGVYNAENWNLSVGLRPTKENPGFMSGSEDYAYEVVFRGYNNVLGTIRNQFEVSASITAATGKNMIRSWKRLYVGAQNTNITGSNLNPSDVEFNSLKYWTQYVDNLSLKQHTVDRENAGISGSHQNISPFDSAATTHDIYNLNSLALNWHFGTITGSDSSGNFFSTDLSSGSTFVRDNFGWAGEIAGRPYPGKGAKFATSADYVVRNELTNEFKFIDPEVVTSDDMVHILTADDELYGLFDEVPKYIHTLEKSLYGAISEEILDYFAGAIDFNNVIGDPVNRYRAEYKGLETLRNIYFEKFGDLRTVEAFTEYYKWFDDALSTIIQQVVPASAEFANDTYNTIESHVLERPKYKTQFPTLEFKAPEPEASALGIAAKSKKYEVDLFGGVPSSPRPTRLHKDYWKKRAQPGAEGIGSYEISSGDATIDAKRRQIRNIKWSRPAFSGSAINLTTVGGTIYRRNRLLSTQFNGVVEIGEFAVDGITNSRRATIKGGVNFPPNKSFAFAYASTYPAGPINTHGGIFVPTNVLLAHDKDLLEIEDLEQWNQDGNVGKKRHRIIGVIQGRDYDGDFTNYTNTKNTFAFPFNIMSGTIRGGIDEWISSSLSSSVTITNLHNDVYGTDLEKPMQGPFTEYAVGGHQSRHVPLNVSASHKGLLYSGFDNYRSRPEAWKLLLGYRGVCDAGPRLSGAIGLVSADYPWPEANATDKPAYPMTASQKAVYYRDFVAKRPVNIKNIRMRTGSTILGNFEHNYEIVHSFDAYANPRQFIENQPALPAQAFQNNTTSSTQTRTILDIHRTDESHFNFIDEYNVGYLTGTTNNSIISTRFGTVGGPVTDGTGYRDFRSNTFSVYNTLGKRYPTVIKTSQGPSGSISEPTGSGTAGIRVFDIHGKDYGLRSHYARHTARFGRDSLHVTNPGASYNQLPGFHKIHRNNVCETRAISCDLIPVASGAALNNDRSLYFLDRSTRGPVLASADTGSSNFITASFRTLGNKNGATVSFWAVPSSQLTTMTFWTVGKAAATSSPLIRIDKVSNNQFVVRTRYRSTTTGFGGSALQSDYTVTGANQLQDGQWHHYAVTFQGTEGALNSTQDSHDLVRIYIDGVHMTASVVSMASSGTIRSYDAQIDSPYAYKGFDTATATAQPRKTGDQVYTFGGQSSDAAVGTTNFSGALDQCSIWTRSLAASEISEIYNGGVPCDLTASVAYSVAPTKLHAWYPLGDPSPAGISDDDAIRYGSNPGQPISGNNIIFDHSGEPLNNMYPVCKMGENFTTSDFCFSSGSGDSAGAPMSTVFPDPLKGCAAAFVGLREDCTFEARPLFDNFFIQHQIPRDSRQYAWITASLQSTASWWHCGFTPRDFLFRSGSTYIEPLNFVSASEVGSSVPSSTRAFPSVTTASPAVTNKFIPQVSRLNLNIEEPIVAATNTMGYRNEIPLSDSTETNSQYVNTDLIGIVGNDSLANAPAFNNLMYKRQNQYAGANWVRMRQGDHPILTNEKRTNKLSTMYMGNVQRNFDLPPLSLKGRPAYINMDYANAFSTSLGGLVEQPDNVTLKTTYNNEMIGFNEQELDVFANLNFDSEVTPFEQLVAMRLDRNVNLNWILYSENLFPSTRREFISSSMTRVGYDNKFWRNDQETRVSGGAGVPNSVGALSYVDFDVVNRSITQSIWPLDAPLDFLDRTAPPIITSTASSDPASIGGLLWHTDGMQLYYGSSLIHSNSAGELQNTYSTYHFGVPATSSTSTSIVLVPFQFGVASETSQIQLVIRNGGLYARKHMLQSPLSAHSPVGISQATSRDVAGIEANNFVLTQTGSGIGSLPITASLMTGSGEAAWEAGRMAGYLTTSNGVVGFVPAPSEPWYNDYDDFRYDIKTIAKGYAVVPEFRISEQISKYAKVGVDGQVFDYLEIPGTDLSSSQDTFYKDYSNSDFMKNFVDVKKMSDLKGSEIRLTCKATIKFNPYKGFYPADRTLDLVSQFSRSYAESLTFTSLDSTGTDITAVTSTALMQYSYARPVMQPLFAPGILYNSIKSGMAVDYPVVTNGYKMFAQEVTGTAASGSNPYVVTGSPTNYMIAAANPTTPGGATGGAISGSSVGSAEYISGAFWDFRVPFEAIMEPMRYINGVRFPDMEVDPRTRLPILGGATASIASRAGSRLYEGISSNFFAEVGKFFLKDGEYTKLRSEGVDFGKKQFRAGEVYGARLRMRTSYEGSRTYENEKGSDGTSYFYSSNGARAFFKNFTSASTPPVSKITGVSGSYELPQDPELSTTFKQNFIMYSRPTAFGPAVSGRQDITVFGSASYTEPFRQRGHEFNLSASSFGVKDSLNGYNWSFTPPYYYGESWVDFIFRPSSSVDYDLARILKETQVIQRRYDAGSPMHGHKKIDGFYRRTLHRDQMVFTTENTASVGAHFPSFGRNFTPYASENINDNAMQVDSCVNLFGIELEAKEKYDKFGNLISQDNESTGQRWVIQPKFETPMMNFADTGVRPLERHSVLGEVPTDPTKISVPAHFGSGSLAQGMWHQFGILPDSDDKGIFMEIGEIPREWLQNHYDVVTGSSLYNNYTPAEGPLLYKNMKSFADLCGFNENNSTVRLGDVANQQVIKEAVVAIPYIETGLVEGETQPAAQSGQSRKQFINIPQKRFEAALKNLEGSIEGDSLDTAGASIRRLVDQMQDYVLPPQFDFLNNKKVSPIVMYMFEFEYTLDKDDLSYIWQNLAPRDYRHAAFEQESTAHTLMNTELLTEYNLLSNPNLRWMVFKVKQRGQTMYADMITRQVDQPNNQKEFSRNTSNDYPLKFNWPYDYISIVETITFDADVKYDRDKEKSFDAATNKRNKQNQILDKKKRKKMNDLHLDELQEKNRIPNKGKFPPMGKMGKLKKGGGGDQGGGAGGSGIVGY